MGASLESVLVQFGSHDMPDISLSDLRADGKKRTYGPKKKAFYRLYEHVQQSTGKVWVSGVFGYKDEWWKVENDDSYQVMTPEEREAAAAAFRAKEAAYQARLKETQKLAAQRAANQFRRARRDGSSDYLIRKHVAKPEAVRFMTDVGFEGWLIIPLLNYAAGDSRLVGVQKIAPTGDKRFSTGFEKIGAACRLGDEPIDGDLILLAEGYASAASAREGVDYEHPVYMALDAGNLLHVAKILRERYPSSPMLFVADDDYLPTKKGDENHAGRLKAEAAAQAVGNARVMLPRFAVPRRNTRDDDSLPELTDINDLHVAEGIDACRAQLSAAIAVFSSPAPTQGDDVSAPDGGDTNIAGGAGGGAGSDDLYRNYALVEGKTRVYCLLTGIEYTMPALRGRFGKDVVDDWLARLDKRLITQAEVSAAKRLREQQERKADTLLIPIMQRYVYLDGSANVWDAKLHEVIPANAARMAMGSKYDDWIDSPERRVIPLSNVRFAPGVDLDPDHYINLYTGMTMSPDWTSPRESLPRSIWQLMGHFPKCQNILTLAYHLCDAREEVFEWLMNWLAYPLQHVGAKMDTAILMHGSVHGSGKSMFWETCVKPLYGRYAITLSQDQLESQYTGSRSGRLFMLFEEVVSSKQRYSMVGKIKHMVTGLTQVIEKKFMNAWEEENHGNCVFLSNAIQPLHVEAYDRRFQVIWPVETADDDIYREVSREVAEGGLEQFLAFLLALPLTLSVEQCHESAGTGERCTSECAVCAGRGWVNKKEPVRFDSHSKPLMTDEKARVIRYGLSGWELFVYQWQRGELDDVPFVSCLTDDLYAVYAAWCHRKNENLISENKFSINVSTYDHKLLRKKRARWRWNGEIRQSMVFKIGIEPRDVTEADWLGKQVGLFKAGARLYSPKFDSDSL